MEKRSSAAKKRTGRGASGLEKHQLNLNRIYVAEAMDDLVRLESWGGSESEDPLFWLKCAPII
jgi:hypothetical protein